MNSSKLDCQEVFIAMCPAKWYEVAELSAILHMPPRQVERALADLWDRGVVQVDDSGKSYMRLVKAHVRREDERRPCQSGARQKREQKREQEQDTGKYRYGDGSE